jgi:DNA-directed RNA polymerase specialized sigma24 family protein
MSKLRRCAAPGVRPPSFANAFSLFRSNCYSQTTVKCCRTARKTRNSREISFDATDDSVKVLEAWRVPTVSAGAEEILGKREEAVILERAIFALRPRVRQVAELVQLRGLTTTETALALGISVAAAKARLFHARNALRKSIFALIRQPIEFQGVEQTVSRR